MTLKQNITSILECYFSGFNDELIESCVQRIMEQIERQTDKKACEYCQEFDCYGCDYAQTEGRVSNG